MHQNRGGYTTLWKCICIRIVGYTTLWKWICIRISEAIPLYGSGYTLVQVWLYHPIEVDMHQNSWLYHSMEVDMHQNR